MRARSLAFSGFVIICVMAQLAQSAVEASDQNVASAVLKLASADLQSGVRTGLVLSENGLSIQDAEVAGSFTSTAIEAPLPFNVVVASWLADIPDRTDVRILLRSRKRHGEWGEWIPLESHADHLAEDSEEQVGNLIAVPAADVTHDQIQFSVSLNRQVSRLAPRFQEIAFIFIDSTAGPTTDELLARQRTLDAGRSAELEGAMAGDNPKPAVISRAVWCTDSRCTCEVGECDEPCIDDRPLLYQPVTHLIVHHTASNNGNVDWAASVRAIWHFHAFSRCWGDVGYNYLVDPNGILYEGHRGGDDVVGVHGGGANAGSMALALLGTFTDVAPPQAMLDSAVDLLAWKADEKTIDVYDASDTLPNIAWGLPNLMGHRDVYGGSATECPGGEAHNLLPWLRDQVAARIGLTWSYLVVDELSDSLTLSNSGWHEGVGNCGHNGHAYYTFSTTEPGESTNWGEWRPPIPEEGWYRVEIYAPYCDTGAPETEGAAYEVHHANGVDTVVISQNDNVGLWMPVDEFRLNQGTGNLIRLTDLTTTDSGKGVWFDAMRLLKVSPPPPSAANKIPGSSQWLNSLSAEFSWDIDERYTVKTTTLEIATDQAFSNIIFSESWPGAVFSVTHTFSEGHTQLFWRVRLSPIDEVEVTDPISSAPTQFGIDLTAPESAIETIGLLPTGDYYLAWSGSDALSGLSTYAIEYRPLGTGEWIRWLNETAATTGVFVPPDRALDYELRSRATDKAGNMESSTAVVRTDQAILFPHAIMQPVSRTAD